MTLFPPLDEEIYRIEKQKNLQKIIGDICANPRWIWIGCGSRRRVTFQIKTGNRLGFFSEKSHDLIEIEYDPLAEKRISDLILPLKNFLKTQEKNFYTQATITLFDNGLDVVMTLKKEPSFSQIGQLTEFAKTQNLNISYRIKSNLTPVFLIRKNQIFYPDFRNGPTTRCGEVDALNLRAAQRSVLNIREQRSAANSIADDHRSRDEGLFLKIDLDSDIFIQATKSGLENIIRIIRDNITKQKNIADIYAGFGAYSFAIYDLAKSIFAFEGSEKMVNLIRKNVSTNKLSAKIKAEKRDLFFSPLTKNELEYFDLAILNPPRNGASPQILEITKSSLKKLIYISCNPQSFKRDAKILTGSGFKITNLTAIDQFYKTKHLELVAIIQR